MTVYRDSGENIESLLRRFKKGIQKSGIMNDMRRHEHAVKPSVRRKRKSLAARARLLKRQGGKD